MRCRSGDQNLLISGVPNAGHQDAKTTYARMIYFQLSTIKQLLIKKIYYSKGNYFQTSLTSEELNDSVETKQPFLYHD